MHRFGSILLALLLGPAALAAAPEARGPALAASAAAGAASFKVLCYHEARDDVRDYADPYAVDAAALVMQFSWLRQNGYTPVSLEDIVRARSGGKPLPASAVLLTFDDAYRSFYTRVYPLLREFRYPAVLGVVGKWIDTPQGEAGRQYGDKGVVLNAEFPTWGQLREMADSGLVEIASHTYDLHRGVPANPQGNLEPAATARIYDAATARYEDDAAWRERVRADLAQSMDVIARETGHRPRAVVWPYGSYNLELVRIAAGMGMPVALTLDDGPNTPDVALNVMRRTLIEHNPGLAEFATEIRGPLVPNPVRAVQMGLDGVYDPDPARQERNLSALLERILALRPSHVYLRATADTDGDGIADAAYFPNRVMPLRADLFNRVAWQLQTRTDVKVYAVMPVGGFQLPRDRVADLYEDLARYANIDGLVFEEHGAAGLPPGLRTASPALPPASAGTAGFIQLLAARARAFRSPLKTVHPFYLETTVAGTPAAGMRAEDFAAMAAAYDQLVVIPIQPAAPAGTADDALTALALRVTGWLGGAPLRPASRGKVLFMLDDGAGAGQPGQLAGPGKGQSLARKFGALQRGGALNLGYATADFGRADSSSAQIGPVMSLREYPAAQAKEK